MRPTKKTAQPAAATIKHAATISMTCHGGMGFLSFAFDTPPGGGWFGSGITVGVSIVVVNGMKIVVAEPEIMVGWGTTVLMVIMDTVVM